MKHLKRISLLISLLFCAGQVLFVHSLVKLPAEPFWTTPYLMYENFAFGMALGLSLPAPYWSALLVLILTGWIAYRVTYWLLRKLSRLVARDQTDTVEGG